jgi:glycosyltransferase involved in cell wall biosynthesis
MRGKTKFSVIVPAFNCKDLIEKTLVSVLEQTYDNFEIIIVDDASTDGTSWYADALSKLYRPFIAHVVHHDRNVGPTGSMVSGHSVADGDVVLQLDGDGDTIDPETFELYAEWYDDRDIWMCGAMLDKLVGTVRAPSPQRVYNAQCNRFGGVQQFHPRSWRKWLWYKIPRDELINPDTGEYWRAASDCSFLWNMWELAGAFRVAYVWKPLYVHNLNNPLNMRKDPKLRPEQDRFVSTIVARQPLLPLRARHGRVRRRPKPTHFVWEHRDGISIELDIKE